jgi:Asp-tRNA(Asn)/Glu-tRNA(Gln) amidotransferase C subunit
MLVIGGRAPLRADDPRPSLALDAALNNGPEVRDNMFVVPRILEEGGTSG